MLAKVFWGIVPALSHLPKGPNPKQCRKPFFLRPAPPAIPLHLLPPPPHPPEERPLPLPKEADKEDLREQEEKEITVRKMEEEIEKKSMKLQEVITLGKESTFERQHVLVTLDEVLPQHFT